MIETGIRAKYSRKARNKQRLLIADGHGSHIRADFIAYYMENAIDLLIVPPYYSYVFQPFDMGVFSAFKHAYGGEIDALFRLNI